jgi:hypothetical protein
METPKKKQRVTGRDGAASSEVSPSPACQRKSPSKAEEPITMEDDVYVSFSPIQLSRMKKPISFKSAAEGLPKIEKMTSLSHLEVTNIISLNKKDSLELYRSKFGNAEQLYDGGLAPHHLRDQTVDLFLQPEQLQRSFSGVSATTSEIDAMVTSALNEYDWEKHCECCYPDPESPQGEQPYALPAARKGKSETWAGEEDVPY